MSLAGFADVDHPGTPPEALPGADLPDRTTTSRSPRRCAAELRDGRAFCDAQVQLDRPPPRCVSVARARVVVAHGRMPRACWRPPCKRFWNRDMTSWFAPPSWKFSLDISTLNTLIVERADTFGLSQLHQLRGGWCNREARLRLFPLSTTVPLFETTRPSWRRSRRTMSWARVWPWR